MLRPPVVDPLLADRRADIHEIAEEASVTAGATAPAQRRGRGIARRHAPAGPGTPNPGPAERTYRLGVFDCPSCGYPIGRGHADDCPARTRRLELTLILSVLAAWAAGWLWLGEPLIAAGFGALAVLAICAYRPPAVGGQDGRGHPPGTSAARAPVHRRHQT